MLGEQHLRRLLPDYVDYYNAESVHTQLSDSPAGQSTENRPSPDAQVVGLPRAARRSRASPLRIRREISSEISEIEECLRENYEESPLWT